MHLRNAKTPQLITGRELSRPSGGLKGGSTVLYFLSYPSLVGCEFTFLLLSPSQA